MISRPLLAAAAALAVATACKTPEQRLVDRRHELRETLDRLYSEYAPTDATPSDPGLVGRIMGEADRTYFEQHCLAIGRGERPFALSGKLDAFMKDPAHAHACRKAADLDVEIDGLQREVGRREGGQRETGER